MFIFLCQHTTQLASASLFGLCLSMSVLRWKSIRMCSRLLAPLSGITLTTRATHSLHYTLSNSSMKRRSPRLCSDWASTQESNGTAPSGPVSDPQSPHGLTSSQVLAGPTRNVTGEAMPTSLPEAVTQLSFLEFLQRCNLLIAPPQPPPLPVTISLLDAAAQTTPPSDASQDVSTQTSDQPVSSLSFDVAVQTPFHSVHISSLDAAVQTLPHSTQAVSTQISSRPASSFSINLTVQTLVRNIVLHDTSTQLPLTEFFIGCIFSNDPCDRQGPSPVQDDIGGVSPPLTCTLTRSSLDCDDHVRTLAPRALLQPPPGLEQCASPPGLAVDAHLCASHGTPVNSVLLRPRLRSAISVTPPQPPACTIHVGTHPARSATRSASTALVGTHNPADTDPRAGTCPFAKPRALVLPLVHFGQSKPDWHGLSWYSRQRSRASSISSFSLSVESRPSAQEPY